MNKADEVIRDLSERDRELRAVQQRALDPIIGRWIADGRPAAVDLTDSDVDILVVVFGGDRDGVLSGRLMGRPVRLASRSGE